MKVLAIILIAMSVAYTYQVSCAPANYCMGCSATVANHCTSCFDWGSGTVGARGMATVSSVSNCIAARPAALATTNCKFYLTVNTSATAKTSMNCMWCNKKYLAYNATTSAETCTDTVTTGCTAIANARFTRCNTSSTSVVTSGTYLCNSGYYASGTVVAAGYPTCTSGSIANCDIALTSTACYTCKSKYAVSSTSTCAAFTTDSNCRQLNSAGTCEHCWDAYYWNTTTCKLASSVLSVTLMAVAAFFFN